MTTLKDRWSIGEAKQRLSEVLDASQNEPQIIENRGKPKSVVISFEEFKTFTELKKNSEHRSIAEIIDDFLTIKDSEAELPDIERFDRPTPFDDPTFYENDRENDHVAD